MYVKPLAMALVRDLRELRVSSGAEEIEAYETDVLAGFVLARASAGLADSTIRNDTGHLDLEWLGRPLWEMQPEDADACSGRVLRDARPSTRTGGQRRWRSTSSSWSCAQGRDWLATDHGQVNESLARFVGCDAYGAESLRDTRVGPRGDCRAQARF